MIAYVTSKVEASENKPWRLGALAVCHNDKKLGKNWWSFIMIKN